MGNIFNIVMIGIASNLDNAGVGISYGIRNIYVSWFANFLISLMSTIATLFAGFAGNWLSYWITPQIGKWLGTIILVLVGVWVMIQPLFDKKVNPSKHKHSLLCILQHPETADLDKSKTISLLESILLGTALAINALAGGFDAGITNLNVIFTSISVGVFSFLLFGVSIYFGKTYLANTLGNIATYVAGILLILIGLHQLL